VLAAQACRAISEGSTVVNGEDLSIIDPPQRSMRERSCGGNVKHAVGRDTLVRELAADEKQADGFPQPLCAGVPVEVNDLLQTT
jgi:hypothetical protein